MGNLQGRATHQLRRPTHQRNFSSVNLVACYASEGRYALGKAHYALGLLPSEPPASYQITSPFKQFLGRPLLHCKLWLIKINEELICWKMPCKCGVETLYCCVKFKDVNVLGFHSNLLPKVTHFASLFPHIFITIFLEIFPWNYIISLFKFTKITKPY